MPSFPFKPPALVLTQGRKADEFFSLYPKYAGFVLQPIDHHYYRTLRYFAKDPVLVAKLEQSVYVGLVLGRHYILTHEHGIGFFSTICASSPDGRLGMFKPTSFSSLDDAVEHWRIMNVPMG